MRFEWAGGTGIEEKEESEGGGEEQELKGVGEPEKREKAKEGI